jgi:hypothetical protein
VLVRELWVLHVAMFMCTRWRCHRLSCDLRTMRRIFSLNAAGLSRHSLAASTLAGDCGWSEAVARKSRMLTLCAQVTAERTEKWQIRMLTLCGQQCTGDCGACGEVANAGRMLAL